MLEDVRQSYIEVAAPEWKTTDVNTLCNLYIQNEKDQVLKDSYFAAIVLKKWGYIGKHYTNSKTSGFSIEQCYDMVIDAILYILKSRKWLDPENKLYNDPNGPDKCLNRCIFSARQRDYYLANRDKRRLNFGKTSLDSIMESVGDHTEILNADNQELVDDPNSNQRFNVKEIISNLFMKHRFIDGVILDNILNDDCFMTRIGYKEFQYEDEEKQEVKTYSMEFKLGKLVNNLYNYDIETLRTISNIYSVKEEDLVDLLPILNKDKGKLSRIVKASLSNLSKDKELRENLCC